ncbi:hypothetical protein DUI87_13550 [Hirundo rustica rustica]|uniref:ribonuclease H n=1 Tax=Hirundo rustica rustica TaxID=333673 RepID=A0A3M0K985_HIRRU|nr:hypothetical protein DUI87_13550 [Hirundo rustica rustica]
MTEAAIRTKERGWIHASRIKGPVDEPKEWTITSEPGDTKLTLKRGLGEFRLWEAAWKKLLRDLLPKFWQDPEMAVDNNNLPICLAHLCGEGEWASVPRQAQDIPLTVLECIKDAASKAFFSLQPDGPLEPYSKIRQLPSEPFLKFVERLTRAIELQVKKKGAREDVLEEMALANVNEQCKVAILSLPMEPAPTLQDMLQIPLHPDNAPRFAFSVPTLNREAPRKRYHWKFLPQGMKNSPSICQWYLSSLLSPVHAAVGEAIILHYMDDVLVCAPNDDLLSHALDLTINSLVAAGFELQEEKIQRMSPWKYLGLEIGKRTIVPQKLAVKNNIKTLADVQQLCGSLNWRWPHSRISSNKRRSATSFSPECTRPSSPVPPNTGTGLGDCGNMSLMTATHTPNPECRSKPQGLNSCEVWQTDVTHVMSFGRQSFLINVMSGVSNESILMLQGPPVAFAGIAG